MVLHVLAADRMAMADLTVVADHLVVDHLIVDPTAAAVHSVVEALIAVDLSVAEVPTAVVEHSVMEVLAAVEVHSAVALPVAVEVPLAEVIIAGEAKAEATAAEAVVSAEAVKMRTSAFIIRWTSRIGHFA